MLTEAQKKWQRDYYQRVRKHDKKWRANVERKKKERLAKADPNVERQYHAERWFRFRSRFARVDLWNGLSVVSRDFLRSPVYYFEYRGTRRREFL